jgi:hypothetical protein
VTSMAKLPIYRRPPCPACGAPTDYSVDESGEIIPLLCDECVRALDMADTRIIAIAREARGIKPRRGRRPSPAKAA